MGIQLRVAECLNRRQVCPEPTSFSLRTGGEHAREDRIRPLTDRARICAVAAADFMARRSPHRPHPRRERAGIRARCADDCDRMGNHQEMRRRAEAHRSRAGNRRAMAAA